MKNVMEGDRGIKSRGSFKKYRARQYSLRNRKLGRGGIFRVNIYEIKKNTNKSGKI